MKTQFFRAVLAAVLFALSLQVAAEDTDLFVGAAPTAGDLPNVLIVLDNTANWNTAFANEVAALKTVVGGLPVNADGSARFRIGFMLFTETGGGNSGPAGGYVRAAMRDLSADYKTKLVSLLNSLDVAADKTNGGKMGITMAEVFYYFSGGTPYSGNNKEKTDYTGNTSGTAASNAICALSTAPSGNALTSKGATVYNAASPAGSCGNNFVIYISNGPVQDNNSDTETATTFLKAAAGGGTAGDTAAALIPLSPSGSQDNVADEWARFMKKSSLGVVTYTIDVDRETNGQGPGWSALLRSVANVSGGEYFAVSSSALGNTILKAMEDIFSKIQSVNSVFAAVSLPVSVNTQGTYRNQVYIGMFRPDDTAYPRWAGNLKQYKLGYIDNVLKLQDSDNVGAINSNTGFIAECVRSYWTPSTVDNYWDFRPLGECLAVANSDRSNYPDGNIVDKGAQAYKLRSTVTRPVKTCSAVFASCTTLIDFNSSAVSTTDLGASGTAERDALIAWAQGKDVADPDGIGTTADGLTSVDGDENGNGVVLTEMRPSAHGDVVHSRPVAINFGTEDVPEVVVFYGGNDGVLRAVNGNRTADIGSVAAGNELWSFIAPEFYRNFKRIRDNNVKIDFPGNTITTHTPLPKPYGVDGPVTAYKDASNAWIYATMRRGGRVLYAFDVDVDDPADITLKWKKGCPNLLNDDNCTTGFSGIGQTWSAAKALTATGFDSGNSPLLMVGGGYDGCEDADPHTCNANGYTPKGNKIYVMNADSGALLQTLSTERSVAADVFLVPDSSGHAKHAYAADTGGNVYRINIGAAAPGDWTMTKIASFGCDSTANCSPNRKLLFAPDVIDNTDGTYTLMIGSGDREKPVSHYTAAASVANHFFVFKDKPADTSWLNNELLDNVCGEAVLCLNSLHEIDTAATPSPTDLAAKKGWYLTLRATEQVVTNAVTIFDVITFSTHIPQPTVAGACSSSLGTAWVYNISYKNASSANGTDQRSLEISGGGLPPSPVGGMVTLDNGTTVPFCIGCNPNSPLEGGTPPTPPTAIQPKARVYWYIEK